MNAPLAMAIICFVLALIPALVFVGNFRAFQRFPRADRPVGPVTAKARAFGASPSAGTPGEGRGEGLFPSPIPEHLEKNHESELARRDCPSVSVLIPARNEAASIAACASSVLANRGIEFELVVLDDHSTDQTAEIVSALARIDDRLRLIAAPPLPAGWCGKQHACHVLATNARYDTLMWIDADVQLEPDAILRMADELGRSHAGLISGFPFEITKTWLEVLLIPLIHFILLGYLPLRRMRQDLSPALGAGCGQLFMARRKDYFDAGGHAAIRASLHDGIALPRAFRRAGKMTDLFDASDIANCRMYDSAVTVWNGLLKNAAEGIASPRGIVPWTVLLFGGQVLPAGLAIDLAIFRTNCWLAILFAVAAALCGIGIRLISAGRYQTRSPALPKYLSAIAHPIGVLVFLFIQWHAVLRRVMGVRAKWKGRSYD